ncbi:MAG: hypothetical protein U9N34_05975 [Candidatus Cloacimonadota bacterium]|nr:hypothetical protein [Candidatus Cloacimonadota bacterium]
MFKITKKKAMKLNDIAEELTCGTDMDSDNFSYGADGTIFYDDAVRSIALRDIESYDEAVEVLTGFIESNSVPLLDDDDYEYDELEYDDEEYDDDSEAEEYASSTEMCKSCAIQLSIDDVISNTLQSPEPITNQVADVMLKLAQLKKMLAENQS